MNATRRVLYAACLSLAFGCSSDPGEEKTSGPSGLDSATLERLQALALPPGQIPAAQPDPTNQYADDPAAAALGQKFFFEKRFSGPLLESDNQGGVETLGVAGEAGRVGCVGCHVPTNDFLDNRSARRQLSLGAGWTRRRAISLLDVGQATLLMWDGRRDTAYNQVFGPIESPLEFNSSPLFVAQQVARYYKDEYEALFGPLPALDGYAALAPTDAGCAALPEDQINGRCPKPGQDDEAVLRVVVNLGKAISAYTRQLSCGTSRFDEWMAGNEEIMTPQEKSGAGVFVRAGCDSCHSGPAFSDAIFHVIGAANLRANFVAPYDDPGAAVGLAAVVSDPLNSRGIFSDGDDGRLNGVPDDTSAYLGAFRTPRLRCVGRRPSLLHAGQQRTLEDVVLFFNRGGDSGGFQGTKDPRLVPLNLTKEERDALVAFLRSLDGPGAAPQLTVAPELPPEP